VVREFGEGQDSEKGYEEEGEYKEDEEGDDGKYREAESLKWLSCHCPTLHSGIQDGESREPEPRPLSVLPNVHFVHLYLLHGSPT
jgi:hypothetical protein